MMTYIGFKGNSPYFCKSEQRLVEDGAECITLISTRKIADYLMFREIYEAMRKAKEEV